jgi:hypothetical protein
VKDNIYDGVLKEILNMAGGVSAYLNKQYSNTRPFNSVKMTPKQQLDEYANFTPDVEQQMRQSVGNEAVDKYILAMTKLQRRQPNA